MPTTVHGSNLVGAFSQLSVAAVKSASFRGGELLDGPAGVVWGGRVVMKSWMSGCSCDVGLLFQELCCGPSDRMLTAGLCRLCRFSCGPASGEVGEGPSVTALICL